MNGDGFVDIVTGWYNQQGRVLLNNGSGVFTDSGQALGSNDSGYARAAVLADLDGDGDLDFIQGNSNTPTNSPSRIFLNDGTGTFTDSGQSLATGNTYDITVGDVNGDGNADIIATGYGSGTKIFLNSGSGQFSDSGQALRVGSDGTIGTDLADVDGDGDLDVVQAVEVGPNRVFLNNGTGQFTDSGQSLGGAAENRDVVAADFDHDGYSEDRVTALRVLANDTDPDQGDVLSVSAVGGQSALGAALSISADGKTVVYDPTQAAQPQSLAAGEKATDTFTYTVSDGRGGSASATATVTVAGVNDAPVISSDGGGDTAATSVQGNTTAVATVTATDSEAADTLVYSISGGNDAGFFAIDPNTGALSFVSAPDFGAPADSNADNIYDVVVSVSDGNGGNDSQAIAVTVTEAAGILDTYGAGVAGSVGYFSQFNTIRVSPQAPNDPVSLIVQGAYGMMLDLSGALGGRAAYVGIQDAINGVTTGSGNDTLESGASLVTLVGGAGDDVIYGGRANDLYGGEGNDRLIETWGSPSVMDGGAGNDFIFSYGFSAIVGGTGNDTLSAYQNISGATISGVEVLQTNGNTVTGTAAQFNGFDQIRLTSGSAYDGDTVMLTLAGPGTVDLTSQLLGRAVVFTGSGGDDSITTSNGNDTIYGGAGNDALTGGLGSDSLYGGAGNDNLTGGVGSDALYAGDGNDFVDGATYSLSQQLGGPGNDTIDLGAGDDSSWALVQAGGTVAVYGGDGNDSMALFGGTAASGVIDGGAGYDTFQAQNSGDISTLTITGVERLVTYNAYGNPSITATAAQLNGFQTIVSYAGQESDTVMLTLAGPGTVDLTSQLLGCAVVFTGSGGDDSITTSNGNDTIYGGAGNDALTGGLGSDSLYGGAGADTLIGGTGNNTLVGGQDNDNYAVDAAGDLVTEALNEGTDTVRTTLASYTLGANVENLVALSPGGFVGTGNTLANAITGNVGNDSLYGGIGDDTLDGGTGNDTLIGGQDNDTYTVDSAGDVVTEGSNAGTDTLRTTLATYKLGGNLENLVAIGTGNFSGTGNNLANSITGGNGNDSLDGGTGNDTLVGGQGNDTYTVDAAGDVVTEASNAGTDTVRTTLASYTLGADLENLLALGTGALAGTGNSLANTITGNKGDDSLDGGTGNDTLVGGQGNDTYTVDAAGDVVTEASKAGTDTVRTTLASYTLGANLENLLALGTAAFAGTGNSLANTIIGNSGNDSIVGLDGNDTLTGGLGNDAFVFNIAPSSGNVDTITDFNVGNDTIRLENTGAGLFNALPIGSLAASAFKLIGPGGGVVDASDRILYQQSTGQLFYDSDGSGAATAVLFAVLSNMPVIDQTDFVVF